MFSVPGGALTKMVNKLSGTWSGLPAMFNLFNMLFDSKSCSQIPRLNNLSNFQHYFLSMSIVSSVAQLRNLSGLCPQEVHQFLVDLLKISMFKICLCSSTFSNKSMRPVCSRTGKTSFCDFYL